MFNLRLPTIEIIAGDTCPFVFQIQDVTHLDIASGTCDAYFSVSPYVNESDTPIISVQQTALTSGLLNFSIQPSDTVNLRGKYVYQLHLSNGRQSEIYGGHLIVYANRNKSVITR